jgi:hypothetical protein
MPKPNGHGARKVAATWINGALVFEDQNGNAIFTIDPVNRLLSLPIGSGFAARTGTAPIAGETITALSTQNITPTAAQVLGGVIEHATATANGTCTLPTAATLDAAIPGVSVGDTFDVVVANTGSTYSSTITTATGLTLKGTVAIPAGKLGFLTFLRTGSAAYNVYCSVSS